MMIGSLYKTFDGEKAPSENILEREADRLRKILAPRQFSLTERIASLVLIFADLVGAALVTALVVFIVKSGSVNFSYLGTGPLLAIIGMYLISGYSRRTEFLSLEYFSEHIIAFVLAMLSAMLVTYVYSTFNISVKPSRAAIPLQLGLFFIVSIATRRYVGGQLREKSAMGSLLIVGKGKKAERFFMNCLELGVKRQIELIDAPDQSVNVQRLETPFESDGDVPFPDRHSSAGCVAVALACHVSQLHPAVLRQLVRLHCMGIQVQTIEAFEEQYWQRVNAHAVGPEWLFASEFRLAQGSTYSRIKRLMDIVASFCALAILSPLLLLIAVIIRIDSRGPAIFRQIRVGREGRPFTMYKFRTMYENRGDLYTQKNDDRITSPGRWLRLFRIDELPQLWNVFMGNMSLIGPRAEWVKCAEIYEKEIPHYHIRHLVPPGITGWAQVKYRYGENTNDARRKFEYDLYYIRHFSFGMDLKIVIKTVHTVLWGKGR